MACSSASLPLRPESWLPPYSERSRNEVQKLSLLGAIRVAQNTQLLSGAAQLCMPLLDRGPVFCPGYPSQS